MTRSIRVWFVLLLCGCLIMGCESTSEELPPPPPRTESPVPPPPPRPIGEPSIQLVIDRSVQTIADSLLNDPAVRETKHRLVLMLTQSKESGDRSASVIRSIQNGLVRNKAFNRTFRIVSAPSSDPAKLRELTGGKSRDDTVLPDSDEDAGPAVHDPRDLYLLSGQFSKQGRFTEYRYTISLRIQHPQKSQTVLAKDVTAVYVWDPDTLQWYEAR